MELKVSAFDSFGDEFDEDQYKFMVFDIETEMTGAIRIQGLKTSPDLINNRLFETHGIQPGSYQLTAFTQRSGGSKSTIVSEMLKIDVFPELEIVPSNLLITPNMRYTLQIVGGPQKVSQQQVDGSHIEIRFDIAEKNIASVDSQREVTGLAVGDATLRYEVIQLRYQKD